MSGDVEQNEDGATGVGSIPSGLVLDNAIGPEAVAEACKVELVPDESSGGRGVFEPPKPGELIVRQYAPEVKAKAYEGYLTKSLSLQELAVDCGITLSTLSYWIHEGEWRKKKRQLEIQLMEEADSKYRKFLEEKKLPVAIRHEEKAAAIEEKIGEAVEQIDVKEDKNALSKLSKAAKALNEASAVSARAVGLSDMPSGDFGQSNSKKTPLVVIGITASPTGVNVEEK